jgi:GNAT superfamily N-acetyltransferase
MERGSRSNPRHCSDFPSVSDIVREGQSSVVDYATISIAFEVRETLDAAALTRPALTIASARRPVAIPWVKNYDAIDGGPLNWPTRFDLATHWAFFAAHGSGIRIGSATVVYGAPDVDMLAGRSDVALLWDIRVAPSHRGSGVGKALLAAVEAWAAAREATWLEVETQNVNVPACAFYERSGFILREIRPGAYPELPDETQLLWYKRLV